MVTPRVSKHASSKILLLKPAQVTGPAPGSENGTDQLNNSNRLQTPKADQLGFLETQRADTKQLLNTGAPAWDPRNEIAKLIEKD